MRYGLAVWNFADSDGSLVGFVEEFADQGFDTMSFSSGQFARVEDGEWKAVSKLLADRAMSATVHSSFDVDLARLMEVVGFLGDATRCITFDPAMRQDSRGHLFDWARMAQFMLRVREALAGAEVALAVEDCPLDQQALDYYADDIPGRLHCDPLWGVLIDVGHMNIRVSTVPYFRERGPQEYIAGVPRPIVEVHLHDNPGDRDSHEAIGTGTTDFAATAQGLRDVGFHGVSTIEIAPSLHDGDRTAEKPLAAESLATWRELMGPSKGTDRRDEHAPV